MTRQARQKKPKPSKRELADARRLKKYGVTPEWYDEHSKTGCEICGAPPVSKSLAVDHCHKWKYEKIVIKKLPEGLLLKLNDVWKDPKPVFTANTNYLGGMSCSANSPKEARQFLRREMKKRSARGVLCFPCNSGLRKFRDNPKFLAAASRYIQRHVGAEE